ncbi:MAG: hypothetical protein EA395_06815 [Phormidium sp. GEM2.Bin31]|nr:hypothetical protein [Phormidium sp. BM_Day4_Bin.17]TVR11888.1 MAG: hypothetical protein EA395_06815 [Phormidium sp. GEM2.Bin31]UCJ12193.1 MAG: hypothetical protein JWS08_21265 [Phormidium sp. PBR-2020]
MEYLVAAVGDRIQAESIYTDLEKAGFPQDNLRIFGTGYQTANDFDLEDPNENAKQRAFRMMTWLIPFGFFGGVTFNAITGLQTFPWAGVTGNQIIGGILGAGSGALGGLLSSGGLGAVLNFGDSRTYRDRLSQGEYLLVIQGSRFQLADVLPIVRRARPLSLQTLQSSP